MKFTVYGKPVPQGSKSAFMPKHGKRPIMIEANPNTKSWRQEVSKAALVAANNGGFPALLMRYPIGQKVPVRVEALFYFDRPKSVKASVIYKTSAPDTDKLQRLVGDSLKGILVHDDAQIVDWSAKKFYGSPARAEIEVTAL